MRGNKIILFFLILLLTQACTKEVNLEDYKLQAKICLYGVFKADDYLTVNITKTSTSLNEPSVTNITDAKVILWSDGIKIEELSQDSAGYYSTKTYKMQTGKTYTITVDVNGFEQVRATDSIPVEVSVVKHNVEFYNYVVDEQLYSTVRFQINDNEKDSNYYLLSINSEDNDTIEKDTNYRVIPCRSDDPVIIFDENHTNNFIPGTYFYVIFNDKSFDGSLKTLNINYLTDSSLYGSSIVPNIKESKFITLRNVSKNMYLYFKSINTEDAIDNYDAQFNDYLFKGNNYYYNLYSNVENGIGIFAGYSVCVDTFILNNEKYKCQTF